MRLIWESVILLASSLTVFIWEHSPLAEDNLFVIVVLILSYFIISSRKKAADFLSQRLGELISIFVLNTVILLILFMTGGLFSNMFFLLYFVAFGLAFIFEPPAVFVFAASAVLTFLPDALDQGDILGNSVLLGSLVLIAPLAYFFGKEFQKEQKNSLQDPQNREEKSVGMQKKPTE